MLTNRDTMVKQHIKGGIALKITSGKGEGIFATKAFNIGETVLKGQIEQSLSANHSHASQIGEHEYVLHAGLVPKVNHSCNPNCGVRVNESGAHDFVAMKAIAIGTEITFDYAMRNYKTDYFPQQCLCGAKECRGIIMGWVNLPLKKKEEYKGFVAPYLLELDRKRAAKQN